MRRRSSAEAASLWSSEEEEEEEEEEDGTLVRNATIPSHIFPLPRDQPENPLRRKERD